MRSLLSLVDLYLRATSLCWFSLVIVNDETVKKLHAESNAHSGPLLNANSTGIAWYRPKTPFCGKIHTAHPLKITFLWVTHYKELILLNLVITLTLLIGFVFEEKVMHEKRGNVKWLWFQGLLKLGQVHVSFTPPSSTQSPSLLTCEWELAKSGRRLHSLGHFVALRNVWFSHTAALHIHRHTCRREVQRVTWKGKVFPGTALENNVYDGQDSQGDSRTHEPEKPWEGAQVCLLPTPISPTHLLGQVMLGHSRCPRSWTFLGQQGE